MADTEMTFRSEGDPAFSADKENDNSSDSSSDKTNVDQTPSSEGDANSDAKKDGDKGFAEDPRWQAREDKWTKRFDEQESRHVSELAKIREDLDQKLTALSSPKDSKGGESETIPSWFGGDEIAWREFNNLLGNVKESVRKEIVSEIQSRSEQDQKRIDEATSYFQTEVSTIESDKKLNPQSEKVDRNKLLKTAMDNDLVDSQGRWNYKAAWQLMRIAPTNNRDRKTLASGTVAENHAESKPSEVTTSDDFAKPGARPW